MGFGLLVVLALLSIAAFWRILSGIAALDDPLEDEVDG